MALTQFTRSLISGALLAPAKRASPQLRITVPFHNRDLKRRTLESIIKQAGLTVEQFSELL